MGCRVVNLGDVIQLEDSKRQPLSSRERDSRKGGYPYYGAQGIVDYLDDYTYEGDYILVAEDGENLRSRKQPIANAAHGRFRVNNHAHVIAATKRCNLTYLRHLLNSMDITAYVTGSTQPKLSQTSLLNMKVELPEIDKQDAIAAFLHSFDAKIATNSKLNGYLADAVDGLFEKALGQAEEKTLTDVVEILSGGTPKTKISEYWEDGEIPFFGPGDANGSTYCLATAKRITQLGLENCNSELYPVDTVFLTARGTVGKVAMAGKPMAMNQSCFAFRGLGVSQPAVYQIIKRAVRSLKAKANGATFAAINTRDLKIEKILVPSDEELTAFEEEAASLHSMMRVNEEESLKLSSLRDALLPKLIAGEIDVSKIDFTQLNSHLAACFMFTMASLSICR